MTALRTPTPNESPMFLEVAAYLANHPEQYVDRDAIRKHLQSLSNDWRIGRQRSVRRKRQDPARAGSSQGSGISDKLGKYLHAMEKRGLIRRHGANRELIQVLDRPALTQAATPPPGEVIP